MKSKLIPASHRLKEERGFATIHHSYNKYIDNTPAQSFENLISIRECVIYPGMGFLPHQHTGEFIIVFPVKGAMEHKKNNCITTTITKGNVFYMHETHTSQKHFEYNKSNKEDFRCIVVVIKPSIHGKISTSNLVNYTPTINHLSKLNKTPIYYAPISKSKDPFILQYGMFNTSSFINYKLKQSNNAIILNIFGETTINEKEKLQPMDSLFLWDCKEPITIKTNSESSFLLLEL